MQPKVAYFFTERNRKFVDTNAELNFQTSCSPILWKLSRLDTGKSGRVEGQKSFLTAGGSAWTLLIFGYI